MSLSSLKALAYNILKETGESINQDVVIPQPPQCSECNKKILSITYESFTTLSCGHIFHRLCIEKKILLTIPNKCPFPKCGKSVELIDEAQRRDSVSSQLSGTSTLVGEFARNVEINSPRTSSQGRPMDLDEVGEHQGTLEKTSGKRSFKDTLADKSSSKKQKIPTKKSESSMLKKLINELSTDVSGISEVLEEMNANTSNSPIRSTKQNLKMKMQHGMLLSVILCLVKLYIIDTRS
jgi:hypothetical protein